MSECRVEIRPAADAWLPCMAQLERQTQTNPWSLTAFVFHAAQAHSVNFVAVAGEQLCGYACGWVVADEACLHNLVVAPAWRGGGVGGQLLSVFLGAVAARGASLAVLEVRASNLPAIALYRKAGFAVAGWRSAYYDKPREAAIVMRATSLARLATYV